MNSDLKQCEQLARHLSLMERSLLLTRLISSLDDFNESECESLWLEEAERRYREYKAGNITLSLLLLCIRNNVRTIGLTACKI